MPPKQTLGLRKSPVATEPVDTQYLDCWGAYPPTSKAGLRTRPHELVARLLDAPEYRNRFRDAASDLDNARIAAACGRQRSETTIYRS